MTAMLDLAAKSVFKLDGHVCGLQQVRVGGGKSLWYATCTCGWRNSTPLLIDKARTTAARHVCQRDGYR